MGLAQILIIIVGGFVLAIPLSFAMIVYKIRTKDEK